MNNFAAGHLTDVAELLTPVNQPMADVSLPFHYALPAKGWLERFTEASYAAWRRNGSQSYGL